MCTDNEYGLVQLEQIVTFEFHKFVSEFVASQRVIAQVTMFIAATQFPLGCRQFGQFVLFGSHCVQHLHCIVDI